MSNHLWLYLLVVGVLTALTPWAIVGEIVLLGSRIGARGAVAFAVGWFCSVTVVATVVAAGFSAGSSSNQTARGVYVAEVALGLGLLALAARRRARNRANPPPVGEPRWLEKLDRTGTIVAFAFGTFMVNVFFVVDAGLRIASADLDASEAALALLVYCVLATGALIAILVVYFSDRAASERRLAAMRTWIARNNASVVVGMIAVVGVVLALKGIVGLVA
jgi:hypothetical protein